MSIVMPLLAFVILAVLIGIAVWLFVRGLQAIEQRREALKTKTHHQPWGADREGGRGNR